MQQPAMSTASTNGPSNSNAGEAIQRQFPQPSTFQLQMPSGGFPRKRSASPQRPETDDSRPNKMMRPAPASDAINIRAEEEAARRMNAGRVNLAPGYRSADSKASDLFIRGALRSRLAKITQEQNISIDEETLSYLSQAGEQRLRFLLTASLKAQFHRTTTSHLRAPPFTSNNDDGKPMWSHRITSDINAVMEALNRQNKDAELSFRASRMDRIAREQEMARLKEIREAREKERQMNLVNGRNSSIDVDENEAGPSTPRGDKSGDGVAEKSTEGASISGSTPKNSGGAPVFGAVKSTGKKISSKKAARDVSAEVQHKMSNATAMRSAGIKPGKYSWMTSAPHISSPLAGKKKKSKDKNKDKDLNVKDGGKTDQEDDGMSSGGESSFSSTSKTTTSEINGDSSTVKKKKKESNKSKLSQSVVPPSSSPESSEKEVNTPNKAVKKIKRPKISEPARRMVQVDTIVGEKGERRLPDDRVLTAVDVMFALEREHLGRGMGSTEEVIWKYQARER